MSEWLKDLFEVVVDVIAGFAFLAFLFGVVWYLIPGILALLFDILTGVIR